MSPSRLRCEVLLLLFGPHEDAQSRAAAAVSTIDVGQSVYFGCLDHAGHLGRSDYADDTGHFGRSASQFPELAQSRKLLIEYIGTCKMLILNNLENALRFSSDPFQRDVILRN